MGVILGQRVPPCQGMEKSKIVGHSLKKHIKASMWLDTKKSQSSGRTLPGPLTDAAQKAHKKDGTNLHVAFVAVISLI